MMTTKPTSAGWLADFQIEPLSPAFVNPYRPGTSFRDNQRYAVVVGMGGVQPPPEAVTPGCSLDGFNVHVNFLDASMRHTGLSWDGAPDVPPWFPDHEEGANTAGAVLFRRYLSIPSATTLEKPVAFLRDLSNGCAVPTAQALQTLGVVTQSRSTYVTWVHREQEDAHWYYVNQVLPRLCYGLDVGNMLLWLRGAEYLPGSNPDAAYLSAKFQLTGPQPWFMRIRLRLPVMPSIPCSTGCSLNGTEELRYWSLSFQNKNFTLASLSDRDLVTDAEGFATLIVGLGSPPPEWVTPANGYTYFDLSQIPDYLLISALNIRSILPSANFQCVSHVLGFRTGEYDSLGGLMGEYAPTVDFLLADEIPPQTEPLREASMCGVLPPELPVPCTTFYQPPAP
jgi:hypothetical protein